jgi:cytoskeletal protein CcmA (bactofilin family)
MDTSDIGTSTSRRGRRGAATPVQSESGGIVVLGPRDSLVGTLRVDGDVRIEGTVEGDVTATGEVTIRSSGTARAQIEARDVVIAGSVDGRINAQDLVSIGETGVLTGELHSARLRVDEGASINATIAMTASGDAPPARRLEEHEQNGSDDEIVDVTGSVVSAEDSEAYRDGESIEASAVFSGSEPGEG